MFISDTSRITHHKGHPKAKSLKSESIQQHIKLDKKKQLQSKGEKPYANIKDTYPHQTSKNSLHATYNLNTTKRHTESRAQNVGKQQILKLGKDKEKSAKNTSIQKKSGYATPKNPYIERSNKNSISIKNKYSFPKMPNRTTASKTSKSTIQLTKSRGNDRRKDEIKKKSSRECIDVSQFGGNQSEELKYKEKVERMEKSMDLLWQYMKQLSENTRINLYKSQKNDERIKKVQQQLHIQENKINSLKFELQVLENQHKRD